MLSASFCLALKPTFGFKEQRVHFPISAFRSPCWGCNAKVKRACLITGWASESLYFGAWQYENISAFLMPDSLQMCLLGAAQWLEVKYPKTMKGMWAASQFAFHYHTLMYIADDGKVIDKSERQTPALILSYPWNQNQQGCPTCWKALQA